MNSKIPTDAQLDFLWTRFRERIRDFKDFQAPGQVFVDQETGYKRDLLSRWNQELGRAGLEKLVATRQGSQIARELARLLSSNIVDFRAWRATIGEKDEAIVDVANAILGVTAGPYSGPDTTTTIFETCERHSLKPSWDALSVMLWALRPTDYFPIKISHYRQLAEELDSELPPGRPSPQRLHSVIQFAEKFREALEPYKPADWIDVQSFIWVVCPFSYQPHEIPERARRDESARSYWFLAAGADGDQWDSFLTEGIAAIGACGLKEDLLESPTQGILEKKLTRLTGGATKKSNDSLACWQFVHEMRPGDRIFAKSGIRKLLGYGEVTGAYEYRPSKPEYQHVRAVTWRQTGNWELPKDTKAFAQKTLTKGSLGSEPLTSVSKLLNLNLQTDLPATVVSDVKRGSTSFWWLNANPKIWDLADSPVGTRQRYTSHNDKGNKRQRYPAFVEAKPGDIVVGYVTSPQKEIVAICRITRGLHVDEGKEKIEFEKLEQIANPVSLETLQAHPGLSESEPIINNQGSLFRLTEAEYEIIRTLIDASAERDDEPVKIQLYDKKKALADLFLPEAKFDGMLDSLREKKNLILQGAPGVGKTFVAKRLAYALVGSDDRRQIETIQFHQSYSYEDFVQGFRPGPNGKFTLRSGVFHQFCRKAQRSARSGKPYVFIIDEINRGNLSKILGELMMLLEPDKRGEEYAMPLAYSHDPEEKFFVPENVYVIGMMNTADRSLAMVDYALRRRFRFVPLTPEFQSVAFQRSLKTAGAGESVIRRITERMLELNATIADAKDLGTGYQIGHSFFCPRDGVLPDEHWYRRVIEYEIVPLLCEYWSDNERLVEEARAALLA